MPTKTLKVFAPPAMQTEIEAMGRVLARYDSFVVVEVDAATARRIARRFPYEDMTGQYRVRVAGREVDPLSPRRRKRLPPEPKDGRPHHYLVQFIGPIKQEWLSAVEQEGGTPRRSMGGFCYVVRADGSALARIRALPFVRWSGHLPHGDRVASVLKGKGAAAARGLAGRPPSEPVTLEVFDPADLDRIAAAAERAGAHVLPRQDDTAILVLELPAGTTRALLLQALSRLHGVARIAPRSLPKACNNVAARIVGQAFAASGNPQRNGLSGDGEIVAICDTGLDTGALGSLHPDFEGRVIEIRSYPIVRSAKAWGVTNVGADDGPADVGYGHGTHVAGSVLGSGKASMRRDRKSHVRSRHPVRIHGMAPGAKLVFQAVEQLNVARRGRGLEMTGLPDDVSEVFEFAYQKGARIHNNSWEGEGRGAYDANCRQVDSFVWQHRDFVIVIAAGNGGSDSGGRKRRGDRRINRMSVNPPGTAKNCITVGASENHRPQFRTDTYGRRWRLDYPRKPFRDDPLADDPDTVAAFSARGPTKDGRFKPDVVAPGTLILSTRSSCADDGEAPEHTYWPDPRRYTYMSGTSMATPITSGCVALLREALRTRHGLAQPTAALLKAWLIAGCVRLPGGEEDWIDNTQGCGRINLERSLHRVLMLHEGPALGTGERARCTFDLPAGGGTLRVAMAYTDYPGHRLVNNLNLIALDPGGGLRLGNGPASPRGRLLLDSRNNVEVLQVEAAASGRWTIDVVASNVPQGPQDFALAAVLV